MHIGHNNIKYNYTKAYQQQLLIATEEQRDLGITITRDLKLQKQTEKIYKTANRLLGFIARNFTCKSTEFMLPLYKSIVQPHLEYAVQFWSPHLRKIELNIYSFRFIYDKMVRVQRKATNNDYQQPNLPTTAQGFGTH